MSASKIRQGTTNLSFRAKDSALREQNIGIQLGAGRSLFDKPPGSSQDRGSFFWLRNATFRFSQQP